MKINELEEMLGVSKANIRYYEKEGLLNPKRAANGYREYGEEDVTQLRKIVIFRKMGMPIQEIKKILNGEVLLQDALIQNRVELEKQLAELKGAINLCKTMEMDKTAIEDFDEDYYWNLIESKTSKGEKFADIVSDYVELQKKSLIAMWEGPFLFPLNDLVKNHGWGLAFVVIFVLCIIRGLSRERFGWGGFFEGFMYPFALFSMITLITIPLYMVNRKYKDIEFEEETKPQSKLIIILKVLGVILYFPVVFFGGLAFSLKYIMTPLIDSEVYIVHVKFALFYFLVAMYLFCVCIWLYGKRGVFGDLIEGEDGFKAHLPKKVKTKVLLISVLIYIITTIAYSTCFDCTTENGVQRRRFFYAKEYTWEELDYYRITANFDSTLRYTVVMKDGVQIACLGGGVEDYNLSEDVYPNENEDFCIMLTKKFIDMGIPLKDTDFDKLEKKIDMDYWKEYLEELRAVIEKDNKKTSV